MASVCINHWSSHTAYPRDGALPRLRHPGSSPKAPADVAKTLGQDLSTWSGQEKQHVQEQSKRLLSIYISWKSSLQHFSFGSLKAEEMGSDKSRVQGLREDARVAPKHRAHPPVAYMPILNGKASTESIKKHVRNPGLVPHSLHGMSRSVPVRQPCRIAPGLISLAPAQP